MVDLDELEKAKKKSGDSGSSSSSKSKKSKSKSKSSSSSKSKSKSSSSGDPSMGADSGTFELDEDELVDPSDKTVSKVSKQWADDGGEMNYDEHTGQGFDHYAKKQVEEVKELHENIREMARNNNSNFDEFTLYMHAMFLNFAQNRVGIAETIQSQFGKDRREAVKLANKICSKAGEDQFMENIVQDMTENLADL